MTGEYMELDGNEFVLRSAHVHCCGGSTEKMLPMEGQMVIVIECKMCRFRVVLSDKEDAEKIDKGLQEKGKNDRA